MAESLAAQVSNHGALMLYFPDKDQIMRINLRELITEADVKDKRVGGFLRDLTDDRVCLRRLPHSLQVNGYVLFVFFAREMHVYHIVFSQKIGRLEEKRVFSH